MADNVFVQDTLTPCTLLLLLLLLFLSGMMVVIDSASGSISCTMVCLRPLRTHHHYLDMLVHRQGCTVPHRMVL